VAICSLVVQAEPSRLDRVIQSLASFQGVEVHAQNEYGKIVISIDHPNPEYCSAVMVDISRITGVMSSSLVFEYQENLEA
jgi:nitrate reductase NapD